MADFIPQSDIEFNTWFLNLCAIVNDSYADYGLTAGQNTALQTSLSNWTAGWNALNIAKNTLAAATETKDGYRATANDEARLVNTLAQADSACTPTMKETAGLPVHDSTRTRVSVPATAPSVLSAVTQSALNQIIEFRDAATPDSKAKPAGVVGAQIYVKVGGTTPPINGDDGMTFAGLDTRTPYLANFAPADAGKNVYYCLRWQNTRGETGPWGGVFMSVVPAVGNSGGA